MKQTRKYKRTVDNKMRHYGETDVNNKTIRINKKKAKSSGQPGEVLDTIVHEELHAKHPGANERNVRKKTQLAMKKLTKLQKSKYYAKYS